MQTQKIYFKDNAAICVFPRKHSELKLALSDLKLSDNYPVIVLIGGAIDKEQAAITRRAIQTTCLVAEDLNALILCGGTDMGVMAEVGQMRWQHRYKFPLLGVAPEALVTWPGGPSNAKFLWWNKKRWPLAEHYSHFVLVPGSNFGDESQWIVETASLLSQGKRSVTVLINGGEVSRKDVDLSLESGRAVIVVKNTGRLADELAMQPNRNALTHVVPANNVQRMSDVLQAELSPERTLRHAEAVHVQW